LLSLSVQLCTRSRPFFVRSDTKNPSQALLTADAVRLRGIGLFVCLSHHSTAAAACGGFAAERRAGIEISIDSGGRPAATAPQQRRRSTALSRKCGQCQVDSRVDEAEHRLVLAGLCVTVSRKRRAFRAHVVDCSRL